jgi:hypothetical protein
LNTTNNVKLTNVRLHLQASDLKALEEAHDLVMLTPNSRTTNLGSGLVIIWIFEVGPTPADEHWCRRFHPASTILPERWIVEDEWLTFDHNPVGNVHVLAYVDERTYIRDQPNGDMAFDHPIAWTRR